MDSVCWHCVVTQMVWHAYSSMIIALSQVLTTKLWSCGTSLLHMNFWLLAEQIVFFQQRIQLVKDILFTKILQLTLNHSWNCVLESCHFEWCYNSSLLLERKIKFLVTFSSSSFAFNHWSLRLIYYYVCHFSKHTMQFSMDKPWINNF